MMLVVLMRFPSLRAGRIWRAAKAGLRLGSAGTGRLRARLRTGTALSVHHSKWTIHSTELRSDLQRARSVEIVDLRPVVLRRTRTHPAGTAIILRHPMRPGIARLLRSAALCELRIGLCEIRRVKISGLSGTRLLPRAVIRLGRSAIFVTLRELRIGLLPAAIKSATLVRSAGLALLRIPAPRMPGCE